MKKESIILKEVRAELIRFTAKLNEAIKEAEIEESSNKKWTRKKVAACKRSALDMKQELTKITQMSKYKYSN